jgi:hypothetical protein
MSKILNKNHHNLQKNIKTCDILGFWVSKHADNIAKVHSKIVGHVNVAAHCAIDAID